MVSVSESFLVFIYFAPEIKCSLKISHILCNGYYGGIIHIFGWSLRRHDAHGLTESLLERQMAVLERRLNTVAFVLLFGIRIPRGLGDQAYPTTRYISPKTRTARANAMNPVNRALALARDTLNRPYVRDELSTTFTLHVYTARSRSLSVSTAAVC